MEIVDRKPVPIYEVVCPECKSTIRYKACEVSFCHIGCPVCGVAIWATTIAPVFFSEEKEVSRDG